MSAAIAGVAIGAAGLGLAGAQAAGAFAPPTPPSAAQQQQALTASQIKQMPATYASDAKFNPKYAALNSAIAWQNLFGTEGGTTITTAGKSGYYDADGNFLGVQKNYAGKQYGAKYYNAGDQISVANAKTPGQLDTVDAALPRQLAQQTVARSGAINDAQNLGPAAYQAIRAYDPSVTGLYDGMTQQAQQRLDTHGALDPWTRQALQQNYRGGEAARGMAGGGSDAAMEAYYLAATQEQRQIQNIDLAGSVAGKTAAYYGDPFQRVINNTAGGVMPSPVSTTANQPNSFSISPGAYALAGQASSQQYDSANAGWASQMGGMQALLSPGTASTLKGIAGYFGGGFTPGAAPAGTMTTATSSYAPGTMAATFGGY